MIRDNINNIYQDISHICNKAGRDPKEVILLAVTKYTTKDKAVEAIQAGIRHIGENRLQDAESKFAQIGDHLLGVKKHMIGHLQTNKVKKVLQVFDMIQSVDSLKLAREIEKQATKMNRQADILIEVNTGGEEQKYGVSVEGTLPLIKEIAAFDHIQVLGLKTMAPFVEDENVIRKCFRDMKNLSEEIKKEFEGSNKVAMQYLSMGMTHDYKIALEEGANMLRIGTGIFQ